MRLLKHIKDGGVELTECPPEHIPAYAILSHTWGTEEQEVTLRDFQQGKWQQKPGSQKIEFCRKQAAADKLDYFWVDTCCIDKSSSAEVQEAITSMFLWYRKAMKCYVYLSDVVAGHDEQGEAPQPATWKPSFRKSRWFTRGWTLQELLAPPYVEFFSREGRKLGDKSSLSILLSETTGIAIEALKGADLSSFSVEQRLSWAEKRETKRVEDKAYSLFGIFGVSMWLNYGEGRDKAMERLLREVGRPLCSLGGC
jgi:hypothetical protein